MFYIYKSSVTYENNCTVQYHFSQNYAAIWTKFEQWICLQQEKYIENNYSYSRYKKKKNQILPNIIFKLNLTPYFTLLIRAEYVVQVHYAI